MTNALLRDSCGVSASSGLARPNAMSVASATFMMISPSFGLVYACANTYSSHGGAKRFHLGRSGFTRASAAAGVEMKTLQVSIGGAALGLALAALATACGHAQAPADKCVDSG